MKQSLMFIPLRNIFPSQSQGKKNITSFQTNKTGITEMLMKYKLQAYNLSHC